MKTPDLVTILGNISQSLYPVQHLITGGAYILGIIFCYIAITKFKKIADHTTQSPSQEHMYTPMMYLVMGAVLLFLPTAMSVMANTVFGDGNVLTYTNYDRNNIFSVTGLFVRTAGLLWFVRGCVLVAHSSEPGNKDGAKGLAFIFAGIIAMNFDNTISIINSLLAGLINTTMAIKKSQGF